MSQDPTKIRLNKYIAQCGVSSRRGADDLVFAGRVTVNNTDADSPGIKVDSTSDTVQVDGKTISLPGSGKNITIMIHKPIETVTTVSDPQGRETVIDLLPKEIRDMRPFPVGRLDFYSEGLLLLTTDGDLCYRLTHPKWHLPKVYRVTIRGSASTEVLTRMRAGMSLDNGDVLAPIKIYAERPMAGAQVIEMTLIQGVNRQIRRMCTECGLTILRLIRVKQGPLTMGELKPREWRELSSSELEAIKKAVELA